MYLFIYLIYDNSRIELKFGTKAHINMHYVYAKFNFIFQTVCKRKISKSPNISDSVKFFEKVFFFPVILKIESTHVLI